MAVGYAELYCFVQANAQNATEHASYVDPPPGFAKAVGRASRNDQHSHSLDEVLPSNFGRKLNLDDGSQGQFLHTSLYLLITNPALLDILLLHNFSKFIELLVEFSLCCAFLHRFPGCEMQLHILFMRIKVQSSKWGCQVVQSGCLLQAPGCMHHSLLSAWSPQGIHQHLAGHL